jgi:hypothetical protein
VYAYERKLWFLVIISNIESVPFVKEEEETRRKRYEEEQLATCTFRPQTKWHLAKERRKKALEAAEREAEEVMKSPRLATPLSVSSFYLLVRNCCKAPSLAQYLT